MRLQENKFIMPLVAAVLGGSMVGLSAKAEDLPLWTEKPTRIDRSRQTFERLPPVQVITDSRTWLLVPDQIKMIDSGAFAFNKQVYRLSEIHPIQPKRYCKALEGGRWPCGRMAMIFLGNLVRGKRLLCDIDTKGATIGLSHCAIISRNVAEEVITQGYGKSRAQSGPLAEIERKAQIAAKLGLWRNPACIVDFDGC